MSGHIFFISGLYTSAEREVSSSLRITRTVKLLLLVISMFTISLGFTSHTTSESQYVDLFVAHNPLTSLVNEATHISCVEGHQNNILDLFLTSNIEKYDVKVFELLGLLHHFCLLLFSNLRDDSPPATKLSVFFIRKSALGCFLTMVLIS